MEVDNNGLPIFNTLRDFSFLTRVNFDYIKNVVHRKIIPYHNFCIPKQFGGMRIISSPDPDLKKIQSFIKNKILDTKFIQKRIYSHVYSYRKSYSIIDNARKHIDSKWMVKVDINNFFNSINEYSVYNFFSSLGYSSFLSFALTRLVTCPTPYNINEFNANTVGSLPQGSPTSPQISNLIFFDIDKIFNSLAKKYNYIYTRYADDIIFSTYENITMHHACCLINIIKNTLNKYGYRINKKKTKIVFPHSKKIVNGIVIKDGRLLLSKKFKEEIKKDIFFAQKNGLKKQKEFINFNGDLNNFIIYLLGKINFANQVEPKFATIWRNKLMNLIN